MSSLPAGTAGTRPVVVVLTDDSSPRVPNEDRLAELAQLRTVTADELSGALGGADVLFVWDFFSPALKDAWPAADALRWVHVAAAGVNAVLFDELATSDVVVTNAYGVFDSTIAEYVAAAVLAHDKQFGAARARQAAHEWKHVETLTCAGRSALIVGTGGIGRACAKLLTALGLSVAGAGRSERTDPDFGQVYASSALASIVGAYDHVVLTAPLTPQTHHLVDETVVAAMRAGAHLINVGRGGLVDEPALVRALRSGTLSATLDVFESEPLPADSALWDLPGVLITAHQCGDTIGWRERLAEQFEAQLRRYVAGQPLDHPVDKRSGFVPR